MSRWSNRFVSLGATVVLAGCSLLRDEPSAAMPRTDSGDSPAAAGTPAHLDPSVAPGAAAPAGVSAAGGAPAAVPVPDQAAQQFAAALKLVKAGQTAEAEAALRQLSAAYPEFAGPDVNLGLLYLKTSRLAEAETSFKTALERNPRDAVAGNELGIVERKLGKFAEAETAYRRTIAADPNYAPAYLNLGVLYDLYLAEPQKALEQFEHYVQLAGENKQVAGWLAELRKRVGAPAPAPKKETA